MTEDELIVKLRKIEQLFARAATDGERQAAGSASNRVRVRLQALDQHEPAIEYRFSLADGWSRALFIALLRRHQLRPYRYRGQRHTTVMVRVTKSFVEQTLWPEFQQSQAVLYEHLEAVTKRVIAQAIGGPDADVEIREGQALEA